MKSRAMIEQALRLYKDGYPIRQITLALGISRNTVRKYIREDLKKSKQFETGQIASPINDPFGYAVPSPSRGDFISAALEAIQIGNTETEPPADSLWGLDWDLIIKERKKGVTVQQLFEEHQPPVQRSAFGKRLRERFKPAPKMALRLNHVAGEKVQVDFADGIKLVCPKTGKLKKTQLFCGVLPFSSYVFATFVASQVQDDFIKAHEEMFAAFGGVSQYVVLDNLKAGVTKANRYDPEINQEYEKYAAARHFAATPARPYTPRDKAAVEATIGAIQRSFYQEVRNKKFYTLDELNREFRLFLKRFNDRTMSDYGVSRNQRFELEQQALQPLEPFVYKPAHWHKAKVHPDSSIQVKYGIYSVPFALIGKTLRVKLTDNLVEIYDDLTLITSHIREDKAGYKSLKPEHFPPYHLQSSTFEVNRNKTLSARIGPKMQELVEILFSGDHPLRYLRRVMGIMRTERGASHAAMEYAATQALQHQRMQVEYFQECARKYDSDQGASSSSMSPKRDPKTLYLHGDQDDV